ncbi:MAG TPA: helix-turn-helix domain-containing protein [Acidobacteriota bacterium]|nr:helix-turn-helix domain-containing protein [Acidobacteriota bacterium]
MKRERRRCPRKPLEIPIQITDEEGIQHKGYTINASPGGLAVVCPRLQWKGKVALEAGSALIGEAIVRFQEDYDGESSLIGLELVTSETEEGLGPGKAWRLQFPGATNRHAIEYYSRLRRLRSYVDDHLEEKITLENAAQVAALERSYFCRYFHQKVGLPFTQWMQRTRLQRSIDLLLEGDNSITEACYDAGFGDLRHFQRTFRRWTDLSPSDFRNLVVAV